MIRRQDVLDRSAEWQLRPEVVEKDYVLGWLLAGVGIHETTRSLWVLKGGTGMKKCYFETYRFSEDLDISLLPDAPYSEDAIREILIAVVRTTSELSGINFPENRVEVRSRQDKFGRPTFEARVYYQGPLAVPTLPRVLFDITQHEPVLDPPQMRQPLHPYPDALPDGVVVPVYSLDEILAEKTRALFERTRPRDLYDVVYLLDNHPGAFNLNRVQDIFARKCEAKQLTPPSASEVVGVVQNEDELRSEWANMLAHQLPQLPKLDDLLARLPELLSWIDQPSIVLPELKLPTASIPRTETLVAPAGIRYWGAPLENIRFAGANRLLVEFDYHGKHRTLEPYSLRQSTTGKLLLYGWERQDGRIKAFSVAEMSNVRVTDVAFQPRYRVELTTVGPFNAPSVVIRPRQRIFPGGRLGTFRQPSPRLGPTYVFQCPYCNKEFKHKKNDPALRKHKGQDGYLDCPGRRGYLVSVE